MAGETVITIVGNLTADPELRTIGQRCDRGELHDCFHPANLESSDQPVRGWSGAVHEVLRLA